MATPSGWGFGSRRSILLKLVTYCTGLFIGAEMVAAVLLLVTSVVEARPDSALAAICAVLFLVRLLPPDRSPVGNQWRVPQDWARYGPNGYSFLFGLTLGTGVLTALTTVGYFSVYVLVISDVNPIYLFLALGAFALGRMLPICLLVVRGLRLHVPPPAERLGLRGWAACFAWAERFLLAALSGLLFFVSTQA